MSNHDHSKRPKPKRYRSSRTDPSNYLFAPVPLGALTDRNLKLTDIRVLGRIAYHDRFGRNGMGCTASYTAIGKALGIERASVSRSVRRLVENEWILHDVDPNDRRKVQLWVNYEIVDSPANETVDSPAT